MISRRRLWISLCACGSLPSLRAQPRPKLVGGLFPWPRESLEEISADIIAALRDLGYVAGRHFNVVLRASDGKDERLPELAKELVQLNVDVLIAATTPAASAAQRATRTIPIVFYSVAEPVKSGFADSLAHPGHNLTGISNAGLSLDPKRLDLMKQMVPGLERVAYLLNPTSPFYSEASRAYRTLAEKVRLRVLIVNASKVEELEPAFREIAAFRAQALLVMGDTFLTMFAGESIAALAISHRLPSISPFAIGAEAGGLMAYGSKLESPWRKVAVYIDKLFRGLKPGDIPIEEPTHFDFVINRKTADLLHVKIPPALLLQATNIIE